MKLGKKYLKVYFSYSTQKKYIIKCKRNAKRKKAEKQFQIRWVSK